MALIVSDYPRAYPLLPVREIAEELNKRKVETLRGGAWHGSTVVKLRQRAKAS
jgi:hypothetical protein